MRSHFVAMTTLCCAVALVACADHAMTPTVAQVERVRAGLSVEETGGRATAVEGVLRVTAGALISTDQNGRGVVVLDHGERVLLDQGTRIKVTSVGGAELLEGRIWTSSGYANDFAAGDTAMVRAGSVLLRLRGVRASIERQGDGVALDVLEGEVAWESGSRQGAVREGSHAVIRSGGADLTARTLIDDWTGGLADEASTGASVGGAMGLGAVAARRPDEQGAPRWALVLQRLDARVAIVGDLAITELEQTFFNPAADTVEGLYTLTVPRGAVLQRFAVDRRGTLVDGFVRERNIAAREYQAQVYSGSTHDPALLEWDAPGRYHARLFPITPAMTRRVLVSYTQWLTPRQDGGRSWRLPLASLAARVGELHIDVDVSRAGAREVRASEGARRDDTHVFFQRSDAVPTADFVLDLRGVVPREGTSVRASAEGTALGRDRSGFVRVSVQVPEVDARAARDEGVDLVVVVDHSAATDAASLGLGQAFVEALVRSLTARDRLLVMAGDVGTRAVGNAGGRLEAVTAAKQQELLDALARDRRGGATDLGAMIQAAHGALDPQRNGSIVYIGDGQATVGEDTTAALRARVARMSPRPRFYAVAVGEAPRLDLLTSIAEPSGFAVRVTRRGEVARAAMDLIAHAVRPLVRDVRADLGPGVERVYPSEPVDVPAGEPLVLIGRYTRDPPTTAMVRATWHGRAVSRTVPLVATAVVDHNDLRYRWASARLDHLLARGESRAVIVELGTRFGLVTPHTSLYVPSEDEPLPPRRTTRTSDTRDFSMFDLVPLVGCSRRESVPEVPVRAQSVAPTAVALPHPNVTPVSPAPSPTGGEGQMGMRAARTGRYAIRSHGAPSTATTEVTIAQQEEPAAAAPPTQGGAANRAPSPEAVDMSAATTPPSTPPIALRQGQRAGATLDNAISELGSSRLAMNSHAAFMRARDERAFGRRNVERQSWANGDGAHDDGQEHATPPALPRLPRGCSLGAATRRPSCSPNASCSGVSASPATPLPLVRCVCGATRARRVNCPRGPIGWRSCAPSSRR